MELVTFGAILTYAASWEAEAERFYRSCATSGPAAAYASLADAARKRGARLERTRREGVSEMILAPISGLNTDRYAVHLPTAGDRRECLRASLALEAGRLRFYEEAAAAMPIREVGAVLARLARENATNLETLATFQD